MQAKARGLKETEGVVRWLRRQHRGDCYYERRSNWPRSRLRICGFRRSRSGRQSSIGEAHHRRPNGGSQESWPVFWWIRNLPKRWLRGKRKALYASKICSYAQGMNLIRAKSIEKCWILNLGELARIWKGGCIIRVMFLDRIKKAYDRNSKPVQSQEI